MSKPLDQYENALVVYLKRSKGPTLSGIFAIWAWRCAIEPDYAARHVNLIAEALLALVERLDLMHGGIAGPDGHAGLLNDAAPGREWALILHDLADPHHKPACYPEDEPNAVAWLDWARLVAVLCSRLYMAEVRKLPGYNHDATEGPFGVKPSVDNG